MNDPQDMQGLSIPTLRNQRLCHGLLSMLILICLSVQQIPHRCELSGGFWAREELIQRAFKQELLYIFAFAGTWEVLLVECRC